VPTPEATILFRNRLFAVGEFRCAPGDARWRTVNLIGDAPHVVYPGTSVVIQHDGSPPVLANRNHVLFYDREQRYRRSLHDERGDHSVFVALEPRLLAGLLRAAGVAGATFPFTHAPCDPRAYLLQHAAVRELRRPEPDVETVQEAVLEALGRSLGAAAAFYRDTPTAARARTAAAHVRLAEDAKGLLTERATAREPLAELARDLHVSEFHLARVFRRVTGYSVHAYRTQLRLRLALDLLALRDVGLTATALAVGFSSHAHFTAAFSASFGFPPSAVQEALGRPRELRRIVEAVPAARA
jgi:AraC-like DNA-binding protein